MNANGITRCSVHAIIKLIRPYINDAALSLSSNEQSAYCINYSRLVQKAADFRCDLNADGQYDIADI